MWLGCQPRSELMPSIVTPERPWYQRGTRVILVAIVGFIFVVITAVAVMTARFYLQIKRGGGADLATRFAADLSQYSGKVSSVAGGGKSGSAVDRAIIESDSAPRIGTRNPQVTIVAFIDFKCPFCKESVAVVRQLVGTYGDRVAFQYRNMPLETIHPGANQFAEVAECAHRQGRFWPVHDYFFNNQETLPEKLTNADLDALAERFALDKTVFGTCLSSRQGAVVVGRDYDVGLNAGVDSTPTFFVNGNKVVGSLPKATWEEILRRFLVNTTPSGP